MSVRHSSLDHQFKGRPILVSEGFFARFTLMGKCWLSNDLLGTKSDKPRLFYLCNF